MRRAYFYVADDERVLQRLRAPMSYAVALFPAPAIATGVLLVGLLAARVFVPRVERALPAWAPWAIAGALLVIAAIAVWRRAATTEYVLTDQRVYTRVGRFVTKLHFTTHDKVTDIRYRQGPLARALGFASLTFATAGGDVHLPAVADAMALKAASERARDAFIRALLGESDRDARAAPAAGAPGAPAQEHAPVPPLAAPAWSGPRPDHIQAGDTPVWHAKPRPIAAIGAMRSLVGVLPLLLVMGAMDPTRRAYAILAAFGLVLIFFAVRLAQLRRTEYTATDRRVYSRRGFVGTTISQLTYDKITDITYQQDILGRMFGYGTVTVQTAGGGQAPISMVGLAEPLVAKETIERWRDATLGRRP